MIWDVNVDTQGDLKKSCVHMSSHGNWNMLATTAIQWMGHKYLGGILVRLMQH